MSERSRRSRGLATALTALALLAADGRAQEPVAGEELVLSHDLRVRVVQGRDLELLVLPEAGADFADVARRVCGTESLAPAVRAWNGGVAPSPEDPVRVPLALLDDAHRRLVLESLFPEDRREGGDWIHIARGGVLPTYDEGLWQVALWFTGDGTRFAALLDANKLSGPELAAGQAVRIPGSLLLPAFRPAPTSDDGSLEYGEDDLGPYAGYRLKRGEAMYSAVVVKYTGRTSAEDVTALAAALAARSGIRDVTDIPVGYLIKIPFADLETEYLPPDHPRRRRAEAAQAEMLLALAENPVGSTRNGLDGVVLILDPGHGGRDLGTIHNGLWEHDYVYDVTCRLNKLLEQTNATVHLTLIDAQTGCQPSAGDKLVANQQGTVQTHPPFLARNQGEDTKIAVNLRWYLANSIYRRALADGVSDDRVLFLSLHADARHPSLRGLMVYVPGAQFRTKTYAHDNKLYRQFREVREKPRVSFSHKSRIRSEAISRKLGSRVVDSFSAAKLPVHDNKPIRDRIYRGRQQMVPAVLRGNEVPAKVLLEMVNLSNPKDARLLASAEDRQRLAEAIFDSIFRFFGETPP